MKEENARSRMYLGVHFRKDCEDGLYLGDIIGKNIMEIYTSKNTIEKKCSYLINLCFSASFLYFILMSEINI
jgi:hypothetical protein